MTRTLSMAVSLTGWICLAASLAGLGCSSSEPALSAGMGAGTSTGGSSAGTGATTGGTSNSSGGHPGAGGGTPVGPSAGSFSGGGYTGSSGSGGSPGGGGMTGNAGNIGVGGGSAGASAGSGGATASAGCDTPGLVWKSANKTNFTSYPVPGSAECIQYSGCMYEGQFAGCDQTEPLDWVKTHNIVAVFPDLNTLKLHDLCLKSGSKTIVVTAIDECGDNDCNGCCTQNKGSADELIDVESFTNDKWGVDDGPIQWADLGPTKGSGCN